IPDFKRLLSWRNQFLLLLRHWPLGTLLDVTPRLIATQLGVYLKRRRCGDTSAARLQARSWWEALLLAPRALAQRLRLRRDGSWTRFLRPPGSVPVITLPVARRP